MFESCSASLSSFKAGSGSKKQFGIQKTNHSKITQDMYLSFENTLEGILLKIPLLSLVLFRHTLWQLLHFFSQHSSSSAYNPNSNFAYPSLPPFVSPVFPAQNSQHHRRIGKLGPSSEVREGEEREQVEPESSSL